MTRGSDRPVETDSTRDERDGTTPSERGENDPPEDDVEETAMQGEDEVAAPEEDEEDESPGRREAVEIEHSASLLTRVTTVALVAIPPISLTGYGLAIGVVGALVVAVGAAVGSTRRIDAGSLLVLTGIVVAAIEGMPADALLLPTVVTVVAWDVGRYGIAVGEQLGADAETARIEVVHAGWSMAVGALALVALQGVPELVDGRSAIGTWALLVGVVLLVAGLLLDS